MTVPLRSGGCRCGEIRFEVTKAFGPIWNCHCRFCRRIHGAAFTTVAIVPPSGFSLHASSSEPATFVTPEGSVRHFCGRCSSPVYNSRAPDIVCVIVASLDEELDETPWAHVNLESKAPWFQIGDDVPQYSTFPDSAELAQLSRQRKARV